MVYLLEIADEQTEREFFQTMMLSFFSANMTLSKKDINEIRNQIEMTYPERSEEMIL